MVESRSKSLAVKSPSAVTTAQRRPRRAQLNMPAQPGDALVAETSSHPVVWQDSGLDTKPFNDGRWRVCRTTPFAAGGTPLLIWGGEFAIAAKKCSISSRPAAG